MVADHVGRDARRPARKPRLFWTMLVAFTLVIVLGVCGMLGFFTLAISGAWQPAGARSAFQEGLRAEIENAQHVWAQRFAEQYRANGDSWANIDRRLSGPSFSSSRLPGYILVDPERQVIASSGIVWPRGEQVDAATLGRGVPVEVRGDQVGTLIIFYPALPQIVAVPAPPNTPAAPPVLGGDAQAEGRSSFSFFWPALRGFIIAGGGLVVLLLALAIIFARRLTRPLRSMTAAAQALEAGRLDVQVQSAPVRELDELARAFNAMARSLAEADHQRRQMTADIAHELRTPLTIIKGRLEGLQDGVYSATPDQIERLLNETALLERLIEDLRLLALADAGQLPLYPEPLEPRELLEDAAAAFAGQAVAQGVALRVEALADLPAISADPLRLAQVLSNLLSNALRHTPAGGSITLRAAAERAGGDVRARRPARAGWGQLSRPGDPRAREDGRDAAEPDELIISVSDSGQGIAAQDLPHIFERFWRADRARARDSGGAGLGLAITRQIVLAHGGAIWAESAPDQGTTISIALPATAEEAQAVGAA